MKSALYMETQGQGPELVLLHGWGLHGGVWDALLPRLTPHFRVTRVDLPGHGRSRATALPPALGDAARLLQDALPADAVWLGWSLGGLLALRAALDAPQRMRGLVLANTTPRFVTAPDWPHALPSEQMREFAADLQQNYRGTLLYFLAMQVRGDESARAALGQLRAAFSAQGEPETESLTRGLQLLLGSDLRSELPKLHVPALVIAGGYDRLTPPQAGEAMAGAIPGARYAVIPKAAHVPFISHAEAFSDALLGFMQALPKRDAA